MYDILESIISYSGSNINNIDTYIVYGALVCVTVVVAVGVDNILKFFRAMLPKNKTK